MRNIYNNAKMRIQAPFFIQKKIVEKKNKMHAMNLINLREYILMNIKN